jgi:hypothetical protein
MPSCELEACERLGIKVVFGVGGGKVESSSWIVEKLVREACQILHD